MTTPMETAFPLGSNWVASTVRSKLAEQSIYCTTSADLSVEDFSIQPYAAVAVFGADGDLELYAYDAADTTTADDGGTTCIVVSGRRYKKRGEVIVRDAALSATTTAQPGSPTLGDTYIVPAAPSGDDWASEAKTVATYTARGWIFREPFVGMLVYVADEDGFYHYDSGGDWIAGLPVGALADGSIQPMTLAEPFAILKVEDQRNAPPGSPPAAGTMYQVGTSPTGAFSGHASEVARYTGSAYVFLAPAEGDTIYRTDIGALYSYRSGTWERTVSAPVVVQSHYVDDVTVSTSTGSLTNRISSPSITAVSGQKLRVTCHCTSGSTESVAGSIMSLGIRIDSTGSLTKTLQTWATNVSLNNTVYVGEIAVPDGSAHTYRIATQRTTGSSGNFTSFTGRAIFEVINPT